jgi:hypothetical protein
MIRMIQPIWMRPEGLSLPVVFQAWASRFARKRNMSAATFVCRRRIAIRVQCCFHLTDGFQF